MSGDKMTGGDEIGLSRMYLDKWLAVLLDARPVSDPDTPLLTDKARIIVAALRPRSGVSTKCRSLRSFAAAAGRDVAVIDGGVVNPVMLAELSEKPRFTGAILLAHKGASAHEASLWLSRLGQAARADHLVARYPWQKGDDLLEGRESVVEMLDRAVYRYVLGQLPPDAPELEALKRYAEAIRASAREAARAEVGKSAILKTKVGKTKVGKTGTGETRTGRTEKRQVKRRSA